MRWDRFFDDLEGQLASEWEAERAALDTEAERLRLSRVTLRERLAALVGRARDSASPAFDFADGTVLPAEVSGVGADWVALDATQARSAAVVAPLSAIDGIVLSHADLLRSARPAAAPSPLADRMTFGFAMRDLVRRRSAVAIHLVRGRVLTGTIDRAGSDHLDIALHDAGAARRADAVTGHRIVPFDAIAWVKLETAPRLP